ncbi:MAG: DUF4365 domain-containing protein [Myxococcota bacterium]
MLYINDKKEELSLVYVHAVAAAAGFSVEKIRRDRDSIDLSVCSAGPLSQDASLNSPSLDIQLKAHVCEPLPPEGFAFDLPVKNYNDLVVKRLVPAILVVFIMPEEAARWLTCSEDALILKNCAYWLSLRGSNPTANTATQRVHVARANLLDPPTLRTLLTRIGREEELL